MKNKSKRTSSIRQTQRDTKVLEKDSQQLNNHQHTNIELVDGQNQDYLQKFWSETIEKVYRKSIDPIEIQLLKEVAEQSIPTLNEVITAPFTDQPYFDFKQVYSYLQLIQQCKEGMLVQHEQRTYLAVLTENQLSQMIQLSQEEVEFINRRHKYMKELELRQQKYNQRHGTRKKLSELTSEMAFILSVMRKSKSKIQASVSCILSKIIQQNQQPSSINKPLDDYISYLIKKNLQKTLCTPKQVKRSERCNRGKVRTTCAACLSSHFEQYNPLLYCSDCSIPLHRHCYQLYYTQNRSRCENCNIKHIKELKKSNKKRIKKRQQNKKRSKKQKRIKKSIGKPLKQPIKKNLRECQLCSVSGLLKIPQNEDIAAHVFCMLVNNLWVVSDNKIKYLPLKTSSTTQICGICKMKTLCVSRCLHCEKKAHPLCAFIQGWDMRLGENEVKMECSCIGIDVKKNSNLRRFVLNYQNWADQP